MKCRTLCRKLLSGVSAAAMLLSALPHLNPLRAEAAENITWSAFTSHTGEPGMYCYTISGNVTNPCETASFNEKADLINEFWFDFSVKEHNGTGGLRVYRADCSYNSSTGTNNNRDFLMKHFVRDSAGTFSFDIWLPGQLTKVDLHLDLNGWLGWWYYERLSFEINSITCGGVPVNTNPSSGNVSSSTYDSDDLVGARMMPIDGESLMQMLGAEHITQKEYEEKLASGEFASRLIRDPYGAVLETATLQNLSNLCDGTINQSFSHSDEMSFYYYTLNLNVYNPVNVNDAAADAMDKFYFDFLYKDNNGTGSEQTYRFDMSWADGKNRNDKYANRFRAINDTGFDVALGLWVPGIVSRVDCLLNMNGGERLGVKIQSILLSGCCVSQSEEWVSSAYNDSKCTVYCRNQDALIDLGALSEEETADVLKQLRANRRTDLRDQYGGLITDTLWKRANKEINEYFDTFTDAATPLELTRSPLYIARNAMSGTVYHAQMNDTLQNYMAGRKSAVESAAEIAANILQEQGISSQPMSVPDKWKWEAPENPGKIVLNGLPDNAVIYRRMTERYTPAKQTDEEIAAGLTPKNTASPTYIRLTASDLKNYALQKSGYDDEIFIDVPESCVIAGLDRTPGTESLNGLTPKIINQETGQLETEVYYKLDKNGNIEYNLRGKPKTDNTRKPKSFSYQYHLTFPADGETKVYQIRTPLPEGAAGGSRGSVMFRNLPDGTEAYMWMSEAITTGYTGGGLRKHPIREQQHYLIHLTKSDLETYSFTADLIPSLYLKLPDGYVLADAAETCGQYSVTFGQGGANFKWYCYSIANGQTVPAESTGAFTFAYNYRIQPPVQQGETKVYTATAKMLSAEKKGSRFVTQYQAELQTVLASGWNLRMLTMETDNPPLVMVSADGKFTDFTGENDSSAKLYLFFPDTCQYTVFDETGTPLACKHISDDEYAALGVDSARYAGFSVNMNALKQSASGKNLTVLALDK